MPLKMVIAVDNSLPGELLNSSADLAGSFATFIGEPVQLALLEPEKLDDLRAWTLRQTRGEGLHEIEPKVAAAASMSSADFVYKDDGRPDWGAMWGSFCELALYGGPPHRGTDTALELPAEAEAPASDDPMLQELRRGIYETAGLFSELASGPWLAVSCRSKRMAAWMCAAIILENVDARCEDEILYVPAGAGFELKNQVKSVITVVAKVNHYWQAHIAEQEALAKRA